MRHRRNCPSARVFRAVRKQLGRSQSEFARDLSLSQSQVSRLESGVLEPGVRDWLALSQLAGIPADAFETGEIDRRGLRQHQGAGGFKLPAKYNNFAASNARILRLYFQYLEAHLGFAKTNLFIESLGVDPDYFVDLDHKTNLQFTYDLLGYMIRAGYLSRERVERFAAPFVRASFHAHLDPASMVNSDPRTTLTVLSRNMSIYETNYQYRIEADSRSFVDYSISPSAHVSEFSPPSGLGNFMCVYKKAILSKLPQIWSRNSTSRVGIEERECFFHGGEKCVYRLAM
jgi:transcriptional regulator with XRE-family HTH domain